jgi:hypothetical protein
MEISDSKEPNTIRHRPAILAGVEFAQLQMNRGERVLVGHGPDSIYRRLKPGIDRCIALGYLESPEAVERDSSHSRRPGPVQGECRNTHDGYHEQLDGGGAV